MLHLYSFSNSRSGKVANFSTYQDLTKFFADHLDIWKELHYNVSGYTLMDDETDEVFPLGKRASRLIIAERGRA